jgi:hypothetical protein
VDLFTEQDFIPMFGRFFSSQYLNELAMYCNEKSKAQMQQAINDIKSKLNFGFIVAMNDMGFVTCDETLCMTLFIKNNNSYVMTDIKRTISTPPDQFISYFQIRSYANDFLFAALEEDYINNNAKDGDRGSE